MYFCCRSSVWLRGNVDAAVEVVYFFGLRQLASRALSVVRVSARLYPGAVAQRTSVHQPGQSSPAFAWSSSLSGHANAVHLGGRYHFLCGQPAA